MEQSLSIMPATDEHLQVMCEIYAHHVLHGTGSFEETPPTREEFRQRWRIRESRHQPTLVAIADQQLAGFAYAASHKERAAYRYTVEDSIYVAPAFTGRGVGRALLQALVRECSKREFRQLIAVIGDSTNDRSIALHKSCGFELVGVGKELGFKFDRWLDIVYMQRSLR